MICIKELHKHVIDGNNTKQILKNLSLVLVAGQSLAISGDSGSGKSTLLHILAALDLPDSGSVNVAGLALESISESQADQFRKQQVGIIFQHFNLIDCLTVWENITFPARINGITPGEYHLRLLNELGLIEHKDKLPMTLSGGEQQRVAIARALAHKPKLVLADEPTGNLDDKNSEIVSKLLFNLCDKLATTLVVVTHSTKVAAYADRALLMLDGYLHEYRNANDVSIVDNVSKPYL
ncbi:MAG: putative ABC transport system ATP-binding protein [Paraglaciecola sp.]|jgi:putative ABC transport system ATP-binding protein